MPRPASVLAKQIMRSTANLVSHMILLGLCTGPFIPFGTNCAKVLRRREAERIVKRTLMVLSRQSRSLWKQILQLRLAKSRRVQADLKSRLTLLMNQMDIPDRFVVSSLTLEESSKGNSQCGQSFESRPVNADNLKIFLRALRLCYGGSSLG